MMTVAEIAREKGCTTRTVQLAIAAGRLKASRFGRAWMVAPIDAAAWAPQDGPGRPRKR